MVGNGLGRWNTMPMVRRTSTGSTAVGVDVLAVEQHLALRPCAPAITSCIRLMVRSTVDLPQPDGPMNAVTARGAMVKLHVADGEELAVVDVEVLARRFAWPSSLRPLIGLVLV